MQHKSFKDSQPSTSIVSQVVAIMWGKTVENDTDSRRVPCIAKCLVSTSTQGFFFDEGFESCHSPRIRHPSSTPVLELGACEGQGWDAGGSGPSGPSPARPAFAPASPAADELLLKDVYQ